MRALMFLSGAILAFALTYFVFLPPPAPPVEHAKPLTLVDIQRRREAHRTPAPARVPTAASLRVSIRDASVAPTGRVADDKAQLDRSMVGLPFALSASVLDSCKRRARSCDDLDGFLERMAAEPRDPDWAPRVEQYIVRQLDDEEDGALRVRALECRATRCAIEVASEAQTGIQKTWESGSLDLEVDGPSAYASELDPNTGIATRVVVGTWRRKSALDEGY